MKAIDFIKIVRDDLKELYDMHIQAVNSNGKQGCLCLNPDSLMERINWTDKDIIEFYVAQGAQIDDAEEFLAS